MNHGPVVFLHQVSEARFIARRHAEHDGGIAGRVRGGEMPLNRQPLPFRIRPDCRTLSKGRVNGAIFADTVRITKMLDYILC